MTRPGAPHGEHRRSPRYEIRMSAEVQAGGTTFTARTRDVSEGGVGLELDRALKEGSEVVLGLFLVVDGIEDDFPPLWVKARVAWCAESDEADVDYGAGVRFEVITDEQKTWLRRVIQYIQAT